MKEILIGLIAGVAAVVAGRYLPANRYPPSPPVRELGTLRSWASLDELGKPLIPATQPDPTRVALDRVVDQLDAEDKTLSQAMSELAARSGCNLIPDWPALEAAGITRDTKVAGKFLRVPGSQILRQLLRHAGQGNVTLAYRPEQGVIRISTLETLARDVVLRVYDVRDIIHNQVERAVRGTGGNTRSGGAADLEAGDALCKLLTETIDVASWRDNGGSAGSARYFAGKLVVSQTPENHDAIFEFLAAMRRRQQ